MSDQHQSIVDHKYINLFNDWGFKRVFGRKINKILLLDFLNSLFEGEFKIHDLEYCPTEHMGEGIDDRGAVFDLLCRTEQNERILIELQKAPQEFFRERELFYCTWPIQSQAVRGEWDYRLDKVFVVGILNFELNKADGRLVTRASLLDQDTKKPWLDTLQFINIEVPKFNKSYEECQNTFEQWLWYFKNLPELKSFPLSRGKFQDEVFEVLHGVLDISILSAEELEEYRQAMLTEAQMKNFADFARKEGHKEGHKEGLTEGEYRASHRIAQELLDSGMPVAQVVKITGLTEEELREKL